MSFFYPTSAEFIEKFGCESYTDEDGLQISTFNNINMKLVFSVSNMQNSISVKIYQDEVKTFSIYDEGAMRVTIDSNHVIIEYLNYKNLYAKKITIIEVYPLFKIEHSTLLDKSIRDLNESF